MKIGILFLGSLLFLVACQSSTGTTNSTKGVAVVKPVEKGEREFQAYLDRKRAQIKGKKAPDIDLKTIGGKRFNPSNMKGKIVLLNFWFAACKPCITEIPSLNELQQKYKSKNVVVISISTDQQAVAEKLAKEKKMRYAVVAGGKSIASQMKVSTFPTSFLIDKEGIIQDVFMGASSFDATYTYTEIKPHIERLLN
ncbi:peroxiredoxin family protein [Aureispira anguillae]|uniref:TlpA family protein disulfide reductase n=1 Tax=Aureispira anguillae TaxID=2864201 RepID=A0A915YII0_9BACT|nr:TlpA disulfide reductase family protein [Aureispira anguillae]BDS13627.1 TlpA family protein disulfide reductase [Aureispira anguillae]